MNSVDVQPQHCTNNIDITARQVCPHYPRVCDPWISLQRSQTGDLRRCNWEVIRTREAGFHLRYLRRSPGGLWKAEHLLECFCSHPGGPYLWTKGAIGGEVCLGVWLEPALNSVDPHNGIGSRKRVRIWWPPWLLNQSLPRSDPDTHFWFFSNISPEHQAISHVQSSTCKNSFETPIQTQRTNRHIFRVGPWFTNGCRKCEMLWEIWFTSYHSNQ